MVNWTTYIVLLRISLRKTKSYVLKYSSVVKTSGVILLYMHMEN